MSQSLAQIYLHLIFSTKERRPLLDDPTLRDGMHRYLSGTCNGLECPAVKVGGVADHVHILCRLGRSVAPADLVRDLKRASSRWINDQGGLSTEFHWQSGYGAFSISSNHVTALTEYIENQEKRHRTLSFQDEFRSVLKKNGLEWDERYVWD